MKSVAYILQPKDSRCRIAGIRVFSTNKELDAFCSRLSRICKRLSWRDAGLQYNSRKSLYDNQGRLTKLGVKISAFAWSLKVNIK